MKILSSCLAAAASLCLSPEAQARSPAAAPLHVYETGGHGFGLGQPGTATTLLMDQFLAWMDMQGLLKPAAAR